MADDTTWRAGSATYTLRDRRLYWLPESWAQLGSRIQLTADDESEPERAYYAVQVRYESHERRETVNQTEVDISERSFLWVRYATADGEDAIERRWRASVAEEAGDLTIVPRCVFNGEPSNFWSVIEVTDPEQWAGIQSSPSGPDDAARVAELYDVDE